MRNGAHLTCQAPWIGDNCLEGNVEKAWSERKLWFIKQWNLFCGRPKEFNAQPATISWKETTPICVKILITKYTKIEMWYKWGTLPWTEWWFLSSLLYFLTAWKESISSCSWQIQAGICAGRAQGWVEDIAFPDESVAKQKCFSKHKCWSHVSTS